MARGMTAVLSTLVLWCVTACSGGSSNTVTITPTPIPQTTKYVAIFDVNCRVLIFDTPITTDMNASAVLGQSSYTGSCGPVATGQNTLGGTSFGGSAVFDASGNLFVTDTANNRILQFATPFSNGMNAAVVIGQSNFTSSGYSSAANGLIFPTGLAIDASGNLWVVDQGNDRVLEFKQPFSTGMAASVAIGANSTGQAGVACNIILSGNGATNNTICSATALAFDASGNLWVMDRGYNRVLEFAAPLTTGMAATLELGHASGSAAFTATQANDGGLYSASALSFPTGLQFDAHGNLWVADTDNGRLLEFSAPFTNGMAATTVLGQPDFTDVYLRTSQNGMSSPTDIAFDASGNLMVSDANLNRVLLFEPPFSNGMNATTVLGSANFTTAGSGAATQSTFRPYGIAMF